jgi:hypothetical protein
MYDIYITSRIPIYISKIFFINFSLSLSYIFQNISKSILILIYILLNILFIYLIIF